MDHGLEPMWRPSPQRCASARITAFLAWLERERGLAFADYESLWRWSVTDLEGFWSAVWHFFDIRASVPYERVLGRRSMPGAEWFPGARLNVADQAFRHATDARPAIVAGDESGALREVSWRELERQVGSLAASLRALGVVPGDRVVAILPNVPQTIVAFLACASVGAVWSVCSPDMGPVAVLDRFRQIAPKVLFATDGYRYGGKEYDRGAVLAEIRAALPSLAHTVLVPNLHAAVDGARFPGAIPWEQLVAGDAPLRTEQVASDHPLWVVYSSGTTGMPKAIVHGHGGIAGRDAQGRRPAPRHRRGRPLLLVHDDRLDHVERAGQRAARRRDGRAVRRQPRLPGPRRAVAASPSAWARPSSARARRSTPTA